MINLQAKPEDLERIIKIVVRAAGLVSFGQYGCERLTASMDLTACHVNACELDLEGLLAAEDGDLIHDVIGIIVHLDRRTGQLTNSFVPRYAKVFHRAAQGEEVQS